jgi:hypothetical protein
MPVPIFTAGEVLTAANMNRVGLWDISAITVSSAGGTAATVTNGVVTVGAGNTSVTISSAFSADFANYRILINNIDFSADGESLLMSLGGVTGNVYKRNMQFVTFSASGFTGTGTATGGEFIVGFGGATDNTNAVIDVYGPQIAKQTGLTAQNSSQTYFTVSGGMCTSTVQSTAFTISCGSGTMTGGQIRVYGYN